MAAVDMHRLYAAHNYDKYGSISIKEFTNLIVGPLVERFQYQAKSKRHLRYDNATLDEPQFVAPSPEHEPREGFKRVKMTKTGSSTKVTAAQRTQGTHSKAGSGAQASCYVCRKYYGPQDPIYTTFKCEDCGTPLCKLDRTTQDKTRLCSCFFEHKNSLEKWMRERARGERRAQEDAENEDRVGEGGEGHRAPVEGPLNRSRSGQGRTWGRGPRGSVFCESLLVQIFFQSCAHGKARVSVFPCCDLIE